MFAFDTFAAVPFGATYGEYVAPGSSTYAEEWTDVVKFPRPGVARVGISGQSVVALYGPLLGGYVTNPLSSTDQDIFIAEELYVSIVGPATTSVGKTTISLAPGDTYWIPLNCSVNVWVNARTPGHKFTAVSFQPPVPYPPAPSTDTFPPSGPTGLTKTIPSYLYLQYSDDPDLPLFINWYNAETQAYVDWFNNVNLPVYTGLVGSLLDWVAQGLYGISRPTISLSINRFIGPPNTWSANTIELNQLKRAHSLTPATLASDDIFKRVITWHFYKGDGKYLVIEWLKRRVARFLYGVNGTDFNTPVYNVSVKLDYMTGYLSIVILSGARRTVGACCANKFCAGGRISGGTLGYVVPNSMLSIVINVTVPAAATTFVAAFNSGVLETPFQYTSNARIGVVAL